MGSRNLVRLFGMVVLAISVMAMSASVAQAKYIFLWEKLTIAEPLTLSLTQTGSGSLVAENGLKIICHAGSGTIKAALSEERKKVTGSYEATFSSCEWVGSEKTCKIKDVLPGLIKAKVTGELIMEGSSYVMVGASKEVATIKTEGELCTIPAKEVVSGGSHVSIVFALADGVAHSAPALNLSLKLGNSLVTQLSFEQTIGSQSPLGWIGIHLEKLSGCETIC